jgi:DNA-binding FadR family transcriptional regulator
MLMGLSVSQQRREAEWLRLHAIIDARERDGDLRLPPEPRLCEEIGVSRARLRGLLKRAEDQGLIWPSSVPVPSCVMMPWRTFRSASTIFSTLAC